MSNSSFFSALKMALMGTPPNPPSGTAALYIKSDGKLYTKTAAGVETLVGPGGSSGPVSASGTASSGPVSTLTVNLPAGRFSSAPNVVVTAAPTTNVSVLCLVMDKTATSFKIYFYGNGGAWTSGTIYVDWYAVAAH